MNALEKVKDFEIITSPVYRLKLLTESHSNGSTTNTNNNNNNTKKSLNMAPSNQNILNDVKQASASS
jgi:hypothetical protein